jgi:hypothetical protein
MKRKTFMQLFFVLLLTGTLLSCKKDKNNDPVYTIQDQPVTGDFTYVRKNFVPLAFDSATQQPILASITLEGTGTLTYLGKITLVSTFKFDLVKGKGSDFATTYTGENVADSYSATGSSQMQPDGSITLTESVSNGTGKFSKIRGGGDTKIMLSPDGSTGTGSVSWKLTY